MCLAKILNFLDSKKAAFYFAIIFLCVFVISIFLGKLNGWLNRSFIINLISFQPYIMTLEVRPGTLLLYSLFGLVICVLLLLRDFIAKIPPRARLTILLFSLIPESIYFYELLWHFFYWLSKGYDLTESYYFFHTKLNVVLLFTVIAVQIMLFLEKRR